MSLVSLSIDRFRNLESIELRFSPQLNVFIGANAAGKTSLLEAIYVLSRGRSFRARNLQEAVQRGAAAFQLVARVDVNRGREIPVGLSHSEKQIIARIDGQPVKRLSELAVLFPVHWLGGNLHRLIEEGPGNRRQYLDWGLFHVKPAYVAAWKRFNKLLKQRNVALRTVRSKREIRAWDVELAKTGEELSEFRNEYVQRLQDAVQAVGQELLDAGDELKISYRKGWSADIALNEALESGLAKDLEQGYTRSGPHRADLLFLYRDRPVSELFSRGQQKLFVIGLQVAQAQLLRHETRQTSLFLLDDLGAELDRINRQKVLHLLDTIEAQAFVTTIDEPGDSGWNIHDAKRFHVKHGTVCEVV
jgi:DNA replication and repair protein RecF